MSYGFWTRMSALQHLLKHHGFFAWISLPLLVMSSFTLVYRLFSFVLRLLIQALPFASFYVFCCISLLLFFVHFALCFVYSCAPFLIFSFITLITFTLILSSHTITWAGKRTESRYKKERFDNRKMTLRTFTRKRGWESHDERRMTTLLRYKEGRKQL